MKPFSKMEAVGEKKPVVTRDGRKVTILGEIPADVKYPVVGFMEGDTEADAWTSDGRYLSSSDKEESPSDLFMESKQVEGWVAFGPSEVQIRYGLVAFATHAWPTEEEAIKAFIDATGCKEPKSTVRISWEE